MKLTRRAFLKYGGIGLGGLVVLERGYDYFSASAAKAKVVIVGGGAAGITMAAYLADWLRSPDITIIEPNDTHYYQPGFTLVAADVFTPNEVSMPTHDLIPGKTKWVKDTVAELDPEKNRVVTSKNGAVPYDFLVLAPGCQMDFNLIEGISRETLGEGNAHCIYDYNGAIKCRDAIKGLRDAKQGRLVFTNTYTKLKCGGAPKKICLLAEDFLRDRGLRKDFQIDFYAAAGELMKPAVFDKRLQERFKECEIPVHYKHRLVSVDTAAKKAVFQVVEKPTNAAVPKAPDAELITVDYDFLHFTPPMAAPDFVRNSPLAATSGSMQVGAWAEADKETLVSTKYKNVVTLGDVAGLPTSKTGAAIRVQAPIAAANLISLMEGKAPSKKYNGYSACPIVTEYGKVLMCEFGYDDKLMPTIPWLDPAVERGMWWTVKTRGLKPMYFHGMLKALV
jgi:sulfide:quinone oxidoreductase